MATVVLKSGQRFEGVRVDGTHAHPTTAEKFRLGWGDADVGGGVVENCLFFVHADGVSWSRFRAEHVAVVEEG